MIGVVEPVRVEPLHQHRRRVIGDTPQADENAVCSASEEGSLESNGPFCLLHASEPGLASREDDQLRLERGKLVEHLADTEQAIAAIAGRESNERVASARIGSEGVAVRRKV